MRSIFAKLTLWFFATLAVSFAAFMVTNIWFTPRPAEPRMMFTGLHKLELETAVEAYEKGGAPELRRYLDKLDRFMTPGHYLLDGNNRDVLTGEDRSRQKAEARPRSPLMAFTTADGRFTMISSAPPRPDPLSFLPYFSWIAILVALMAWVFARHLAKPLRLLSVTVRSFGAGDLSLRTKSRRHDELGDLARDFDTMADRLETLLTAERRLLQDISHELRSPLTRLSLAVQMGRAESAQQDIARLSELISELTDMTRAEGDPSQRPNDPIDLSAMLRSIRTTFDLDAIIPDGIHCQGREVLLRRAIENVVQNAVRHTVGGGKVTLQAEATNTGITIRVRDFGPGVPEAMLTGIFRPFFRVQADRSRDSGGVGLGLAIAQRAIRLHHGALSARNAQPGLEVTFTLPH